MIKYKDLQPLLYSLHVIQSLNGLTNFIDRISDAQDVKHVYQSYVALVDKRINRNKLIELTRSRGIQTQIGTYACHVQPVYNSTQKSPNSLEIFNMSLALPMYYALEEEDIDMAAVHLKKTLGN